MRPICLGTGLIALDVILNGSPKTLPKISAGGSCGNVLSILAYLNWDSFPVARLANNNATHELLLDFQRWNVQQKFLTVSDTGSTAIIIHRILRNKQGKSIHRFEFRNPERNEWFPAFKPITINIAKEIIDQDFNIDVFYFDRMNPGTYELAKHLKDKGTLIFFEPSSIKDLDLFEKFLGVTNILKFSNERIKEYKNLFPHIPVDLEIVTLGKDGLIYRCSKSTKKDEWKSLDAFPSEEVVDTAGAGDWCSAGIISKIGTGGLASFRVKSPKEIEQAISYGQLLGVLNCSLDGARGLMYQFSKKELEILTIKLMKSGNKTQVIPAVQAIEPKFNISKKI